MQEASQGIPNLGLDFGGDDCSSLPALKLELLRRPAHICSEGAVTSERSKNSSAIRM